MSAILRPGLLEGASVLMDTVPPRREVELVRRLSSLGARVIRFAAEPEALAADWVGEQGPIDALVIDCSAWVPGEVEQPTATEPLQRLLDRVWSVTAAVANEVLLPGGEGGRIVLVAPADRERVTAPAAVAALENLSRTLSVEWARYGITVSTVAPSADTSDAELGTVVGYLLSPAGGYFSGTRLDLGSLSG
jgi:citronellol/citronellal dehydrogenase